ncbi:MAG: hypothetical protein KIT72_10325 [Polyangiaceae bacterium]|nr:hypothetical protein [Polyangiaceae bacterium]MCW5790807.1 hypothetical protein [Polyangiaceae bacterium]
MIQRKAWWVLLALVWSAPAVAQTEGEAAAPEAAGSEAPAAAPAAGQTPAGQGEAAAPAAAAEPEMDGATYQVRLRDLEARVDELKEQIRRSHTRLSLLSETILGGGVGGARAEIVFTNELSSAFKLVRALFVLDGAVQYNKKDEGGALADQREIPIFTGSVTPGDHTIQSLIQLRGHGYGVFSYLRGYRFEVKSSHSFTVTEGKTIRVDVTAWEKGGVTTPLEQRPAIRHSERLMTGTSTATSQPQPGGSKKSGASGGFSVGTGGK